MPDFFDYPKMIIEELQSRGYNVDFICNESDEYRHTLLSKTIIHRAVRKIFRKYIWPKDILDAENAVDELYAKQISNCKNKYDYVICIKGDMFPDSQYRALRERYKQAIFLMYQWDDLSLLIKTTHSKWFDKKYSYNIEDCKKNSFQYLPMFSKTNLTGISITKKYDIAIIGTIDRAHEKRLRIIEKIYSRYKDTLNST